MNARGQKSPVDEGRKVAGLYDSFTESPSTQSSWWVRFDVDGWRHLNVS